MGCRRYFAAASRAWSASRWGWLLDLLHELANTEVLCLFHNCMWLSRHSWSQCLYPRAEWTVCPLTGLTVLVWSASTFSSASLSLSTRSTETGTQLWLNDEALTGLTVLEFVLSQPNKTSFPISLVSKPGGCSLTGLPPCLIIGFWILVGFVGSLHYLQQLLNPILSSNYLLKEIFGGGRGDAYTFSYMTSPVSTMIAFGIQ